MQSIILASTSPFRRQLLERLDLPFRTASPDVDETALPDESPEALVRRLAEAKARAVMSIYPTALIIGSDQVALLHGEVLGKPGAHEQAVKQLQRLSGQAAQFLTALCLLNSVTGTLQTEVVSTHVVFRRLSNTQIEHYLEREPAYQCAGSFKSEGLGISLLDKINSDDPTALIGLPLIRLAQMLEREGVAIL